MSEWVLLFLVLFGFIVCILFIQNIVDYFYSRLAKSWNLQRKANKVNKKIEKELKKL